MYNRDTAQKRQCASTDYALRRTTSRRRSAVPFGKLCGAGRSLLKRTVFFWAVSRLYIVFSKFVDVSFGSCIVVSMSLCPLSTDF
jgi:hypothetical protein